MESNANQTKKGNSMSVSTNPRIESLRDRLNTAQILKQAGEFQLQQASKMLEAKSKLYFQLEQDQDHEMANKVLTKIENLFDQIGL
jgi:hypothetical protein